MTERLHTYLDGRPIQTGVTGTIISTQVDRLFIESALDILGDVRALYVIANSGTTLTDKSKNARVLTWSEEVSGFDVPPKRLGSGLEVTLNGIGEEGDAPDSDDLSFGDGKVDQAMTLVALARFASPAAMVMLSKYDTSAGEEEYLLEIDGTRNVFFNLYDDSAGARIGRQFHIAAQIDNTYQLLIGTSDGSGASSGMTITENAARVDDADNDSGTYVAMENGTERLALGYKQAAGVKENFLGGGLALAAVVGKELLIEEQWQLMELCNSYFGLSLAPV
jgi:hypothetical protein